MAEVEKKYVVMMGAEVMFGPEADYAKVKAFADSLSPAIKSKCTVKTTTSSKPSATAAPATATPATAKAPASAAKEASKPVAPVDGDAVFGSYLEGGGPSDLWKPKDGKNIIRILPVGGVLPSDWSTPYPFILSGVHPKVGLSLNDMVYCARLTHKKACPLCQFIWNLYSSKDENDVKLAKRMKAYNRVIANIIDLSDVEKGVQKFAFGKTLARKIFSYMEDPEFKPLLDAEQGHNFVVIKKTVDGYPNYDDSRPEVKITPLSSIYPKWKDEVFDLRKEIAEKSYEELAEVLANTKKAIMSTDPGDILGDHTSRRKPSGAVDGDVVVVEESEDSIQKRLSEI
jgi:hypothetical protein